MSTFKHSSVLFTDDGGQPLKFYMRPCAEKRRLRPVIEHGGGVLSNKWSDGMYRLIEPGSTLLTVLGVCLSSQFIWDCVEKNCLQDIEKYKITLDTTQVSDMSDDEAKYTVKTTKRSLRTRNEYAEEDDYTILDYIIKSRRYREAKGRRIWVNLQDRKVLPNRTWQSLKERYVKKIVPNIDKYNISEKYKKLLSDPFTMHGNDEELDTSNPDDVFTFSDDLSLLHNLFESDRLHQLQDDDTWKEIECVMQTSHSWKSLKTRFFKKIIPLINIYDLSSEQISELKKVVKISPLVLSFAGKKVNKLAKNKNSKLNSSCSGSECSAEVNIKVQTEQRQPLEHPIASDEDDHGSRTSQCAENRANNLEAKSKKLSNAVAGSSLCKLAHESDVDKSLHILQLSSDEKSDVSNFEKKCLMHCKFQQMTSKVPVKKLSMKALQHHVAEIDESPSRDYSSSLEKSLEHMENERQHAMTSDAEISAEETTISQEPVTVHHIIEALDGDWSENSDRTPTKLLIEESDNNGNRAAANVSDDKKREGDFETIKKLFEKNVCVFTRNTNNAKIKSTEHSVIANGADSITLNDNCGATNYSDQMDRSFHTRRSKYRRHRKPTNKTREANSAQNANGSVSFINRKRPADNLMTTDSEMKANQDTTLSSSLNIALKFVEDIKEKCKSWCSGDDASAISIPVNSANCIRRKVDELRALLYKTHLIVLSNEIMKKPPSDIEEDDVVTLLKFIIVHGNYSFEDISKMFSNKTNYL